MSERVVITGGTRGIGLCVVKKYIEKNADIHVIARNFEKFPYKDYEKIHLYTYDFANLEGIKDLVKEIGDIDILINNAGLSQGRSYDNYPEQEVDHIVNVNLRAPILLITEFARTFIRQGHGRVVNVASQASEIGHTDIWYGVTKAGLVNATKAFATELGEKGVVVNAVSPGPVETEMTQNGVYGERYQAIINRTYLKRIATAEEVASVIVWLGSDSPEYINGENIDINNGAQRINK